MERIDSSLSLFCFLHMFMFVVAHLSSIRHSKDERVKLLQEIEDENKARANSGQQDETVEAGTKRSRKKNHRPKISFEDMAKTIAKRWKNIDPDHLEEYKKQAKADKERYEEEIEVYLEKKQRGLTTAREQLEATVSETTKEAYLSEGKKKKRPGSATGNPKPSKKK
jgi:hypothetical protein